MIVDLPAGWPEVVRAVVAGPGAWASAHKIARRIGVKTPTAAERCAGLEQIGWLASFEWDSRTVYTLTETSIERLAVRLEPDAEGEKERWVESGAKPVSLRSRHVWPLDPELADLVVDREPTPDELAIEREEFEKYVEQLLAAGAIKRRDEIPWPRILLTGSATVWRESGYSPRGCNVWEAFRRRRGKWVSRTSAVTQRAGAIPARPVGCECCHLLPLDKIVHCLRCGRYGLFEAPKARKRKREREAVRS